MLIPTPAVAAVLAAAATVLSLATAATAAPTSSRPSGGTYATCMDDAINERGADYECDGAICSCCYTDGCFICENNPNVPTNQSNCHWEPPYHVQGRDSIILQPGGILNPGPATPPSSQRPTAGPADSATQ